MARPRKAAPTPKQEAQREMIADQRLAAMGLEPAHQVDLTLKPGETFPELAADTRDGLAFLRSFMPAAPSDAELVSEPDISKRASAITSMMSASAKGLEVARVMRTLMSAELIKEDALRFISQMRLGIEQLPVCLDQLGATGEERTLGLRLIQELQKLLFASLASFVKKCGLD
jgi:hypothetical protein